MRRTSVIPAAVLAAGFVFFQSSLLEGTTVHHQPAVKTASGRTSSTHKESQAKTSGTLHKPAQAGTPAKASHLTHPAGTAVVRRASLQPREQFGPFLPAQLYDFPRPVCHEFDAVVEAHEHQSDVEAEEPVGVAESVPANKVGALARVARTLGALLRPKSSQSTVRPEDVDLSDLLSAGVQIPVEGVDASRLKDSFLNSRGKHQQHLAIDIGAPRGTPVVAAADGEIVQLRREKRGGISLYQKDATGRYLLFYCHLTKYAADVRPGRKVSRGDVIAYVGRTGHVIGGPHLHFSITRLPEDDDNFKAGVAVNPYLLFLAAVN